MGRWLNNRAENSHQAFPTTRACHAAISENEDIPEIRRRSRRDPQSLHPGATPRRRKELQGQLLRRSAWMASGYSQMQPRPKSGPPLLSVHLSPTTLVAAAPPLPHGDAFVSPCCANTPRCEPLLAGIEHDLDQTSIADSLSRQSSGGKT